MNSLKTLDQKEQISLALKYVPENMPSPRAYVELVRNQIMGTDRNGQSREFTDLLYFLQVSNRAGLDPTMKQIYPVYRWDSRQGKEVMSIQTGIDGLRAIAARSGDYGGSDDAIFEEKDGNLIKATVTVWKVNQVTGERMAVTASAYWDEYVQTGKDGHPMGLWSKMPRTMLEKCAESKALRKAFPNLMVGIYSQEEMQQASKFEIPAPAKEEVKEVIKTAIDTEDEATNIANNLLGTK